jgi:hypothetical protein
VRFLLDRLPLMFAVAGWATAAAADRPARVDASRKVRDLTGARARLVWVQDLSEDSRDTFARREKLRLMGFDTHDGKGERPILARPANYVKPLLTPDGKRVVFSSRLKGKAYVVGFDGRGLREVADGLAVDAWRDPAGGAQWVYVAAGSRGRSYERIRRFRLDDPKVHELVWGRTRVSADNFQVSADGTRASGLFPQPAGGVASLPNRSWQKRGRGCWTSLAPDNSYLFWVFDGPHRNVYVHTPRGLGRWKVSINGAPGIDGYEVYHPRWSNHVRFIAMTGPYKVGGGGNRIGGGGRAVEVYLGRFNRTFSAVEKWARVSRNDRGDFYPDAWVEGGETSAVAETIRQGEPAPPKPAGEQRSWPGDQSGLVFLWEDVGKTNQVASSEGTAGRSCRIVARGKAVYGRHGAMDLAGGAFLAEDVDEPLLAACRKTNQLSVEAVVTTGDLRQDGPARIVTFSRSAGSRNFTLGQSKSKLIFRLRTTSTDTNGTRPQLDLCEVRPGQPMHVIVSYYPGRLVCYVNGKPVLSTMAIRGDLSNWEAQHLLFGDEHDGGRDWSGTLEGVCIYNRFIGKAEAGRRHALYSARFAGRRTPDRLVVRGRLIEATPTPSPKDIEPYRRALVVHTYKVEKVLAGVYKPSEIVVAHWAILDGKVLAAIARRKRGAVCRLALEKFGDNPQLEAERLLTARDEFGLDLYYDPSR